MTTATPTPFFAIIVDHSAKTFDVHGPLLDDTHLCDTVCQLQEAGVEITMKTRAQRGPSDPWRWLLSPWVESWSWSIDRGCCGC